MTLSSLCDCLTCRMAEELGRPFFIAEPQPPSPALLARWKKYGIIPPEEGKAAGPATADSINSAESVSHDTDQGKAVPSIRPPS